MSLPLRIVSLYLRVVVEKRGMVWSIAILSFITLFLFLVVIDCVVVVCEGFVIFLGVPFGVVLV